jgi:hypothetical protein
MLHKLMGLILVAIGIVLAMQSHWITGALLLIVGAVLAAANRRSWLTTDTGSAYDGGSGWTTSTSSSNDWNTSGNGSEGDRDCSTGDNHGGSDSGGGDCGGGDGGGGD